MPVPAEPGQVIEDRHFQPAERAYRWIGRSGANITYWDTLTVDLERNQSNRALAMVFRVAFS
jgi:hypothetical protein